MRRALAAGAAVGVLALAACEVAGWPFLAQPLQHALSQRLARPVTLEGGFSLRLLGSPRLAVGHARVAGMAGVAGNDAHDLLDAQALEVRVRWSDLLRAGGGQPLPLQRVAAQQLVLHLQRDAGGHANWQLGHADRQPGPRTIDGVRVRELHLPRARVHLDDQVQQLVVDIDVKGPGGDNDVWTATADGRYRGQPLKAQAQASRNLGAVALGEAGHYVAVDLRVTVGRASASFDGSVVDPRGVARWQGALRVAGPSLAAVGQPLGLTPPTTGAFSLQGQLQVQGTLWSLDLASARIGRSNLSGQLAYNRADPARGRLTGRLTGPALWLQDLGPAVGATPGATTPGRVLPDRSLDLPSLSAMEADVDIRLGRLALGQPGITDLAPASVRLQLHNSVLTLADLEAGSSYGRVGGYARIDARQTPALWSADLDVQGLDLAHAWPRTAPGAAPPPFSGRLDARVRLQGRGRSVAQVLGGAQGRVQARLRDGRASHVAVELAGLDVAQALGVTLRGDDALQIACASLDVPVQAGVAQPVDAVVDTRDSTLWSDGRLSLVDERLQLLARVVPKDTSPLALRSPLRVDGTLGAPAWHVQRGALARRVMPALALAAVHPALGLLPMVDRAGAAEKADAQARVERCKGILQQPLAAADPPAL